MPPALGSLVETGLTSGYVDELLLKILYLHGARTGEQLVEHVCLPFTVLDEQLSGLQHRRLVEVRGAMASSRYGFHFDVTGAGRERASEALSANGYAGPAPVTLAHYRACVEAQSVRAVHLSPEIIREGLGALVLSPALLDQLGPAINSGRSLFLHGESGNGKTAIAELVVQMLGGDLFVPYAVDVDGQTLMLHDPLFHRPAAEPPAAETSSGSPLFRPARQSYDRRFARVKRPVVIAGGELTLEQLDLRFDAMRKTYQAPFQMKANGGVLIIDDFGRQWVPPRDLLNRWIGPLENRTDYLTLQNGAKFPVPFDSLLIFATNLDPAELVEEAFLRRIQYKIRVEDPTPEEYREIFRRGCSSRGVPFRPEGVDHIYSAYYRLRGIVPRACHPRDILNHLCDAARYFGTEPELSDALLDRACGSYFLSTAPAAPSALHP